MPTAIQGKKKNAGRKGGAYPGSSTSGKQQEKCLDRLTDNQAKQRWIKVAQINLQEAEKKQCTFTPSVNQSGRRFAKNQKLFESLH